MKLTLIAAAAAAALLLTGCAPSVPSYAQTAPPTVNASVPDSLLPPPDYTKREVVAQLNAVAKDPSFADEGSFATALSCATTSRFV